MCVGLMRRLPKRNQTVIANSVVCVVCTHRARYKGLLFGLFALAHFCPEPGRNQTTLVVERFAAKLLKTQRC